MYSSRNSNTSIQKFIISEKKYLLRRSIVVSIIIFIKDHLPIFRLSSDEDSNRNCKTYRRHVPHWVFFVLVATNNKSKGDFRSIVSLVFSIVCLSLLLLYKLSFDVFFR